VKDRAQEIIARGDPATILRMGLAACEAAERGEFCECEEPSLHGRDLMCGHCLYENRGQIERWEALMRSPHPFEGKFEDHLCRICAGWSDDPRHLAASAQEPAE
jgi:hypothetical protein